MLFCFTLNSKAKGIFIAIVLIKKGLNSLLVSRLNKDSLSTICCALDIQPCQVSLSTKLCHIYSFTGIMLWIVMHRKTPEQYEASSRLHSDIVVVVNPLRLLLFCTEANNNYPIACLCRLSRTYNWKILSFPAILRASTSKSYRVLVIYVPFSHCTYT